METIGADLDIAPRIVAAHRQDGHLLFLLPLQIRRRQGIRVLEWLGTPHHNYGTGLFAPEFLIAGTKWFHEHWERVLESIGGFDAIALTEMPASLNGRPNPMAGLCNLKGPSPSFLVKLQPDFQKLYAAKRSSDRRRTARKQESGLAHSGEVQFGLPADTAEKHRIIDILFRDQQARLAELGIHGVFGPAEQKFIHRLADLEDARDPILATYFLSLDREVLSVALGGLHDNGYWALISSLSAHPARKYSPGDIALRRAIEACCSRGLDFFDLGPGDAAYKRGWADETVELRAIVRGVNARGFVWAGGMALRIAVKRTIKTAPALHAAARFVRRTLFGRRPA